MEPGVSPIQMAHRSGFTAVRGVFRFGMCFCVFVVSLRFGAVSPRSVFWRFGVCFFLGGERHACLSMVTVQLMSSELNTRTWCVCGGGRRGRERGTCEELRGGRQDFPSPSASPSPLSPPAVPLLPKKVRDRGATDGIALGEPRQSKAQRHYLWTMVKLDSSNFPFEIHI